ncbi:c-type cytochrome [Pedobacter frigoris]|uniref:Photosynthetic reaction center cytochrome c subunit n=2 Tax=Pedobacter frigoris TaxID=2571272 RepID=A0A4U1CMD6_9SPHI|nr:c-type cytochrome [Pedobacter frigoris]
MQYKKTLTLSCLMITVGMLSAFMPKQQEQKAKNLKVLPKNISHQDLEKLMRGFNSALGVRCNFCHSPQKDDPKKMDFASDEKKEKEIARDMMRMTAKINKKYFHDEKTKEGKALLAVSCVTCHNGKSEPKAN